MPELLNVLYIAVVVIGTYVSAVIVNGRHVCNKCGAQETHPNKTHVHIPK